MKRGKNSIPWDQILHINKTDNNKLCDGLIFISLNHLCAVFYYLFELYWYTSKPTNQPNFHIFKTLPSILSGSSWKSYVSHYLCPLPNLKDIILQKLLLFDASLRTHKISILQLKVFAVSRILSSSKQKSLLCSVPFSYLLGANITYFIHERREHLKLFFLKWK